MNSNFNSENLDNSKLITDNYTLNNNSSEKTLKNITIKKQNNLNEKINNKIIQNEQNKNPIELEKIDEIRNISFSSYENLIEDLNQMDNNINIKYNYQTSNKKELL